VEAEDNVLGDADVLFRDDAEDQSAGGDASPSMMTFSPLPRMLDVFLLYAARAAGGFGDEFAISILPAYLTERLKRCYCICHFAELPFA
jgi:hypothetical protein